MWDYIIVGAGSSGCAAAWRLSQSGRERVLVLEAGPGDQSWAIRVPSGSGFADITRFDWGYHSEPDPTRNGKSEHWTRGRVVGGTSSINGMNYVRGSAEDYHRWAEMGNKGWAPEDVMPIFQEMECCDEESIRISGRRGRCGPLHVRQTLRPHSITEAFIRSAGAAGYAFNQDYNAERQEGIGYSQLTQYGRRRWSAADAFLRPALARKNVELIVKARVLKVCIAGGYASGVLYEKDGIVQEVKARHVVLCGGAINTPHLLMLSGVGDGNALRQHAIDVVLDRKSVGEGLLEHPLVRLIYKVKVPTYNITQGGKQKLQFLCDYVFWGHGPLAAVVEAIAFLKASSRAPLPDIQLHFLPFGYDPTRAGRTLLDQMLPSPSITILVNKNYPESRGKVSLASEDPRAAPTIEPRLLDSQSDLDTLIQGIAVVRNIVRMAPIADLITEEVRPGSSINADDEVAEYVRRHVELAYHPAGTCRMGTDAEAVVTPDLKVRGMENLWIADASVLPDLISGNTNAVCMMIGYKLGTKLAGK